MMLHYLQDGALPEDDKLSKQIVAESKQYDIVDGVLHFENSAFPNRWCIVVPEHMRSNVLDEAHAGCFAAHFAEKKVYDRLRRSVWWKGMKGDVRRHCRSCLICASRKGIHLRGFSRNPAPRSRMKTSRRCCRCSSKEREATRMSSK